MFKSYLSFTNYFSPREKELKIKQKERCWQGILHPCKPQAENSHKLELQACPLIHIYTSPHLLQLYPPPLPVSNPGPFPQGLRAAGTRIHICFCLAQGPKPLPPLPYSKGKSKEGDTKTLYCQLIQPPQGMPDTEFKAKVGAWWAGGGSQKSVKMASRARNL